MHEKHRFGKFFQPTSSGLQLRHRTPWPGSDPLKSGSGGFTHCVSLGSWIHTMCEFGPRKTAAMTVLNPGSDSRLVSLFGEACGDCKRTGGVCSGMPKCTKNTHLKSNFSPLRSNFNFDFGPPGPRIPGSPIPRSPVPRSSYFRDRRVRRPSFPTLFFPDRVVLFCLLLPSPLPVLASTHSGQSSRK